jgi:hypothetical protein
LKSTEKEQNFSFPTTKHKLVIAEKPSVAISLAAVLGANEKKDGYMEGGGYLVSWCVGHLPMFLEKKSIHISQVLLSSKYLFIIVPFLVSIFIMLDGVVNKNMI